MESNSNVLREILKAICESEKLELDYTELLKQIAPILGFKHFTAKDLNKEVENAVKTGINLGLLNENNKIVSATFMNLSEDQNMTNDENYEPLDDFAPNDSKQDGIIDARNRSCRRRRKCSVCRQRRRRNTCHRRRRKRCC